MTVSHKAAKHDRSKAVPCTARKTQGAGDNEKKERGSSDPFDSFVTTVMCRKRMENMEAESGI